MKYSKNMFIAFLLLLLSLFLVLCLIPVQF